MHIIAPVSVEPIQISDDDGEAESTSEAGKDIK